MKTNSKQTKAAATAFVLYFIGGYTAQKPTNLVESFCKRLYCYTKWYLHSSYKFLNACLVVHNSILIVVSNRERNAHTMIFFENCILGKRLPIRSKVRWVQLMRLTSKHKVVASMTALSDCIQHVK